MSKFFLIISIAAMYFGNTFKADAHVLQVSGSIGAVMHIDPDDDPIAGQQNNFFFEFKDQNGVFGIDQCICMVEVKEGNTTLTTLPLTTVDSKGTGTFSYTFPKRDAYTIVLSGRPEDSSTFTPFSLTYSLRVERQVQDVPSPENKNKLPIFQIIAVLTVILGIGVYAKKGRQ